MNTQWGGALAGSENKPAVGKLQVENGDKEENFDFNFIPQINFEIQNDVGHEIHA